MHNENSEANCVFIYLSLQLLAFKALEHSWSSSLEYTNIINLLCLQSPSFCVSKPITTHHLSLISKAFHKIPSDHIKQFPTYDFDSVSSNKSFSYSVEILMTSMG